MEFRIHQKLRERIKTESRDMAFIALPGMGLSTLFSSLGETQEVLVASIEKKTLEGLWDQEYKNRKTGRRFVIHAATIQALVKSGLIPDDSNLPDLYQTNLAAYLGKHEINLQKDRAVFILIDDFDDLPDDLALTVCDEMKRLSDIRDQDSSNSLRTMRFVIGGTIDFLNIYNTNTASGVSPATNFCKCRPYEFLLSVEEAIKFLEISFPELGQRSPAFSQLIIDWSGGYIHYIAEFAKWLQQELKDIKQPTIQELISCLKGIIEEQDRISLLKYCFTAWEKIKDDSGMIDKIEIAIRSGFVIDNSEKGRQLIKYGLMIEKPGQRGVLFPANRIIELFLRQRLAEMNLLLPIEECSSWAISSINANAYSLLHDIENRLRFYIADKLFLKYGPEWKRRGFGFVNESGNNVYEMAIERMGVDQQSIYGLTDTTDSFLTFLEFGDLGDIVEKNDEVFVGQFPEKLPDFLEEINYYRRRIAHNRQITLEQISALETRWNIIQRIMSHK